MDYVAKKKQKRTAKNYANYFSLIWGIIIAIIAICILFCFGIQDPMTLIFLFFVFLVIATTFLYIWFLIYIGHREKIKTMKKKEIRRRVLDSMSSKSGFVEVTFKDYLVASTIQKLGGKILIKVSKVDTLEYIVLDSSGEEVLNSEIFDMSYCDSNLKRTSSK